MNAKLTIKQQNELIEILRRRFEKNRHRHSNLQWDKIQSKLLDSGSKLISLNRMEQTGGEPDVIQFDSKIGCYWFVDCSAESPTGRRSLCYDNEALQSRKEHKPETNVVDMAAEMGIDLLSEDDYYNLQQLDQFDSKTSSWLKTPADIRRRGGALFGDFRFGRVFIYHNGAQSYYAARAFRGKLLV